MTLGGGGAGAHSVHAPTFMQDKVTMDAVYVQDGSYEVMMEGQVVHAQNFETVHMGNQSQNVVEIPTEQVQINEVVIPEVQVVEKQVEVPQVVKKPVEQIREEQVQVPRIIPQERVSHRSVEQIVHVPVQMVQEEVVNVPRVIPQESKRFDNSQCANKSYLSR